MTEAQRIQDLGEISLLQRLFRFCPGDLVGDDGAVLSLPADQKLVVTTDVLVDGVHFSDRTTSPEDTGWRAVAANLSDLAAMGATPIGLTVGLSLPGQTPVTWVESVYQGMGDCLQRFGGDIIGGDLCRSDTITLAITALGTVPQQRVLYRRNARVGHTLIATGYHGLSRAGLELLLDSEQGVGLSESLKQQWMQAHQRPVPRLDVPPMLTALGSEQDLGTIAVMDSSDGLANAVMLICAASSVGAALKHSQLPICPELIDWVGADQALDWTLYGGEDFELVMAVPPDWSQPLLSQLGPTARAIGTITQDPQVTLYLEETGMALPLNSNQGFQHF